MRYGYWLPVFGGWLRNVEDEQMEATWEYASRLARRSEEIGFDLTLIAELNLNDIKGADAPALDAWSTAAALAAVTDRLELMVVVRPTFHLPAILAKQAANIDHIAGPGRLSLNVVSSWWADEAKKYGVHFEGMTIVMRAQRNGSKSSIKCGNGIIFLSPGVTIRWKIQSCSQSQSHSHDH
jgi:dimethylsulfone monooxygenase